MVHSVFYTIVSRQNGSACNLVDKLDLGVNVRIKLPTRVNTASYLNVRVIKEALHIAVCQRLREHHVVHLPAPADDRGLDMDVTLRVNGDDNVAVRTNGPGRVRDRERRCVIDCHISRRRQPRGIRDHLEEPRDEPILVDHMIVFCGNDVETECVRLAVGQERDEGRQVQEVRREVESSV